MNKPNDNVDAASFDSFPASDPPSYTPVMGSGNPHRCEFLTIGKHRIIRVPNGRGDELCHHLAAHGIDAKLSPAADAPYERVQILGNADLRDVQTILDQWEC